MVHITNLSRLDNQIWSHPSTDAEILAVKCGYMFVFGVHCALSTVSHLPYRKMMVRIILITKERINLPSDSCG